jgi:hypothetical protein
MEKKTEKKVKIYIHEEIKKKIKEIQNEKDKGREEDKGKKEHKKEK